MTSRTFYYAQAFRIAGRGVAPGRVEQCRSADDAKSAAERLAQRGEGAAAYRIDGDPQADVWGDAVRIAQYGRVAA